MATGSCLSIITLKIPIHAGYKRPTSKDTNRLKVKGWKKIFHINGDQKEAGVGILLSDKTDVEIKALKRDKGHYVMIKGSIQEEDITIINIYAPNIGAPQM